MAEMPTCNKCGQPHWRFAKCATVAATPTETPRTARPVQREFTVPAGYVQVGPGKFAKASDVKPSYVQVAPGKYRKAS